jgi:hypothetical protein
MRARRAFRTLSILIGLSLAGACTSSVEIKNALELTDTGSGWYDAGIVEGKNKIVPSVSFRLRKKADVDLRGVALNVVFRHPPPPGTTTPEDWDEVFLQNAEFSEGDQTAVLTVRTPKGYTGDPPQTRLDLMKHSNFRDVRAHIYAKHSSTQWVEVGTIDVQRQLLTR